MSRVCSCSLSFPSEEEEEEQKKKRDMSQSDHDGYSSSSNWPQFASAFLARGDETKPHMCCSPTYTFKNQLLLYHIMEATTRLTMGKKQSMQY